MNKHDARRVIRSKAGAHQIVLTSHVREQMEERFALYEDVRHALMNASTCYRQEDGTWHVRGEDLDGIELGIIVEVLDQLIVVTLFDY